MSVDKYQWAELGCHLGRGEQKELAQVGVGGYDEY
jgi:hypothetical protein